MTSGKVPFRWTIFERAEGWTRRRRALLSDRVEVRTLHQAGDEATMAAQRNGISLKNCEIELAEQSGKKLIVRAWMSQGFLTYGAPEGEKAGKQGPNAEVYFGFRHRPPGKRNQSALAVAYRYGYQNLHAEHIEGSATWQAWRAGRDNRKFGRLPTRTRIKRGAHRGAENLFQALKRGVSTMYQGGLPGLGKQR